MTATNKVVELAVANNPSYDAVQAMPLDTARIQKYDANITYNSVDFELADDTLLVELSIFVDQGSTNCFVCYTDSEERNYSTQMRIPVGESTIRTFATTCKSRTFSVILDSPSQDFIGLIQILEC